MSTEEQETEVSWRPLGYLAALVIAIWLLWGDTLLRHSSTIAEAGQTGDLYGGINALFSGLAFAALIFTVHLQRKELSDQRKELKATRGVFQQQEQQMQQQNRELRKQIFESRFFQWVNLHHSLVGALKYSDQDGRKVLAQVRNFFLQEFRRPLGLVVFTNQANYELQYRALASKRFTTRREDDRSALVQAYEYTRNIYILTS
jgi:hypothetical protein